jgi:hypothetical protein
MIAWKSVVVVGTVIFIGLSGLDTFAQQAGTPIGVGSYSPSGAQQPSFTPGPGSISPAAATTPNAVGAPQSEQSQNSAVYPNYPYPQYNNPYYDGGSPGNMVSGAIDWALSFPSSAWDRLSEFLDNKVFPRAAATYGGAPQVQTVAPGAAAQQPQSLPQANSYNPDSR